MKWNFRLMKKNYIHIFLLILTVFTLVLSACEPGGPKSPTQVSTTEEALPTSTSMVNNIPVVLAPADDLTMVCGRVVRPDGTSLENLNVRLAEVYYGEEGSEGAFVLNTASSPSAMTNEDGSFCTAEIAVTDYILVVGNPDENYEIYSGDGTKAVIWTTVAGEVLEIGDIVTKIEVNP